METIFQWGMEFIYTVQQVHGPVLDNIFKGITFLGTDKFYIIFISLIYWCLDSRMGARLGIILLLTGHLNFCLKDILQQPRPFNIDPGVKLADADGYGLPSGHAQSSMVVWGFAAARVNKLWFGAVAALLVIAIGFSRVFLGVHFPTDVLVGWAIGAVILCIFLALLPIVEGRLLRLKPVWQILLALFLPLVLAAVHPSADTILPMSIMAGAGVGLPLTLRYLSFTVRVPWWQRCLRFIAGSSVVFLLYLGIEVAFSVDGVVLCTVLGYLGYGLIGFWITFGAPWLFRVIKLAPGGWVKVYFLTHSATIDSEVGLASGWNDTGLSPRGIRQAAELGTRFKNMRVDLVCCSDLERSVNTARIAFGDGVPLIIDRRLREIDYGDLSGKPEGIVAPMGENRIYEPFQNGESYEQAIARVHDFCRELRGKHSGKVVLIVGHRATRFGLDTFAGDRTLEECLSTQFAWQPYWEYTL